MKFEVNDKEMDTDGDWMQCPECEEVGFPLLGWMSYCPMCRSKLTFGRPVFAVEKETEQ